jgi:hypothetical protein
MKEKSTTEKDNMKFWQEKWDKAEKAYEKLAKEEIE